MFQRYSMNVRRYTACALLIVTLLATLLPPAIPKSVSDSQEPLLAQLASESLSSADIGKMNERILGIIHEALHRLLPEVQSSEILRIFVVKNYLWTAGNKSVAKPNQYSRQNHLSYNLPLVVYRLPAPKYGEAG